MAGNLYTVALYNLAHDPAEVSGIQISRTRRRRRRGGLGFPQLATLALCSGRLSGRRTSRRRGCCAISRSRGTRSRGATRSRATSDECSYWWTGECVWRAGVVHLGIVDTRVCITIRPREADQLGLSGHSCTRSADFELCTGRIELCASRGDRELEREHFVSNEVVPWCEVGWEFYHSERARR